MDRRLFLKRGAASLSVPAVLAVTSQAKAEECAAIQLAFSPHGGGEAMVLNTIDSATRSIRLMAYSFTSPSVVRALLVAKKARGVDVAVTVDYRNNMEEDRRGGVDSTDFGHPDTKHQDAVCLLLATRQCANYRLDLVDCNRTLHPSRSLDRGPADGNGNHRIEHRSVVSSGSMHSNIGYRTFMGRLGYITGEASVGFANS